MAKPTFYEFFAGGGMARAGLGDGWECLFANDFDPKKRDAYVANWGAEHFRLENIKKLQAEELPGHADLAWASFPCQDLSLAGNGAGLNGERSGFFWDFWSLMNGLKLRKRAPKILVLENVVGALTSNGGQDFRELCTALNSLGYVFGALTMDAAHFVPQSRPRLFIVALRKDVAISASLVAGVPTHPWASAALVRAQASLRPDLRKAWRWWSLPTPPRSNVRLADIIEENPPDVEWHSHPETQRFISMMSETNREKLRDAKKAGRPIVGTIYRRTRQDENGDKAQRAEVRFDGVAGCLRTPGGGSSRQFIMVVEGPKVRTRLLSGREAARLMGLPEEYKLPPNYNDAYHLLGDGLAVPVISYLSRNLLQHVFQQAAPFREAAE
jgi:DNA (cytosine-5)-methyltransferase 1